MQFKDIPGHSEIIASLRQMADTDRIPHAILFGGVSGIGKMMTARAFAQYVQCRNRRDGESCGECPSCRQHQEMTNPDVNFIYPVVKKTSPTRNLSSDYREEWKQMLSDSPYMKREHWLELIAAGNSQPVIYVNEAEEISRNALMSSYASKYKIFIIWLPEAMQPQTANKLLKLIEEPWENTLFIFVSDDPGAILPTIFSRTQRFIFKPLPAEAVRDYLIQKKGISTENAARLAPMAEGSILKAEELALSSEESVEFGDIYRQMMRAAYSRKLDQLLTLSERLASEGREKIMRFLTYSARMSRENFIYNLHVPSLNTMTADEENFSTRFSPFINTRNVEPISEEIDRAKRDIGRNANARMVLFDFMLQLCRLIRTS